MPRKKNDRKLIAARRAQIVDGARRCFAERGFAATGVEDLERACGLTRGTLFKYFPNKEAMLLAVIEAEVERRDQRIESTLAGVLSGSVQQVAKAVVAEQIALVRRDPWGPRLRLELIALAERAPALRRRVRALERGQRAWRLGLIKALQSRGLIHPSWDAEAATDLISCVFLGLVADRAYAVPSRLPDAALADGIAAMLTGVLEHPPP